MMTCVRFLCAALLLASCGREGSLGDFDGTTDVGEVRLTGTTVYDARTGNYRVTASGADAGNETDAFHFVWRRASGDLAMSTDVSWVGNGANDHRQAGWMVRASLDDDAPFADAVVHGDGLIALQYRQRQGGPTGEVRSAVTAPATIRLERHGHLFSMYVARPGGAFQPVGSVTVELGDSVFVGLAVTSHDEAVQETALFSNVQFEDLPFSVGDDRVVESTLEILNIETGERRIVRRAVEHFEAPNWSLDGSYLVYNGGGLLYRIPVEGGEPELIPTGDLNRLNNDHGFSPDGTMLAISHSPPGESSKVYVMPAEGGEPRLVTELWPSYWHGWSPDGSTLAYVGRRNGQFDIYTIPVEGGQERQLTNTPGLDDGPDYSPDGRYIYFNSIRTGRHAIWRMGPNGENPEQMTFDEEYGDWFPHPSPDGRWAVFLSYDADVEGHPANRNVVLRIMPLEGGEPRVIATLFGGQGTINVPSWSPDSREFAFVSYRLVGREADTE